MEKRQTIYLAFIEPDFTTSEGMTGHIIEAEGYNWHDEDMPFWREIKYGDNEIEDANSFDGFYQGIGPHNEPCLIFTELSQAIRTLFLDMECFCRYATRMYHYDILRPQITSDEMYSEIIFTDKDGTSKTIQYIEVENLFNNTEKEIMFGKDESESFLKHILEESEYDDFIGDGFQNQNHS